MTNAENIYKAFGIRKAIISLQKVQKRPAAEVPRDRRGRPYSDPSVTGKRLASDAPKTSESQVGVRGARQKFTPDEVPTVGVRGGQQRFTPKQKMAMSKALIPLQKFLDDDCGCEGDTLMQNKATKGFSDKATMAIREGTVRGLGNQKIMMPRTQAEVIRSGEKPKESSYDRKHGRMSRDVPQGREWSTSEPAKRFPSPKNE